MNETTAAALSTFQPDPNKCKKKSLVFHLGGGMFDVSLLNSDDDVLEVIATSGNTQLGGEDFNERVIQYLIKLFEEKTGKNVRTDNRAVQKLRHEVEKAKQSLSSQHQTNIEIESFFDNENFCETLTRTKFEELNIDLFHAIRLSLEHLLKVSQIAKSSIDEIILIGGSTRIGKVQELIKDYFHQAKLSMIIVHVCVSSSLLRKMNFIFLIDISPGFRVKSENNVVRWISRQKATIPTKKSEIFSSTVDDQSNILVEIFQDDKLTTGDDHLFRKFELTGIPPALKGVPLIEILFVVDINGILS